VSLAILFLRCLSVNAFGVDANAVPVREGQHKLCVRDVLKRKKQIFITLFNGSGSLLNERLID
jgi:hypothetical protein